MSIFDALIALFKQEDIEPVYHGTLIESARAIVSTQTFIIPTTPNSTQTLGPGVYFWEGSLDVTVRWAERNFPDQEIGYVKARLELKKLLDLRVADGVAAFNLLAETLIKLKQVPTVTTAQVLAFGADIGQIDSSRTSTYFDERRPWKLAHVVVCVYDTSVIKAPCFAQP